jgi:hypothetical protein
MPASRGNKKSEDQQLAEQEARLLYPLAPLYSGQGPTSVPFQRPDWRPVRLWSGCKYTTNMRFAEIVKKAVQRRSASREAPCLGYQD